MTRTLIADLPVSLTRTEQEDVEGGWTFVLLAASFAVGYGAGSALRRMVYH